MKNYVQLLQFFSIAKTHFLKAALLFSKLWTQNPIFKLHSQNLRLFLQNQTFTSKQFNLCSKLNYLLKSCPESIKIKNTTEQSLNTT